jgi:hypothetical protein
MILSSFLGSVMLLIRRQNFPVRARTRSNWTDHSCEGRKLICEGRRIRAVDRELAFADHVDQLNPGKNGTGGAE